MAKRFLVPLDRTSEAEAVISLVAGAARETGGTVRLLHVAPVPGNVLSQEGLVVAYADQEMARLDAEAMDYLSAVELRFGDVPVERAVRFGDPVTEILSEAESFDAEVIAVATTCRSGVRRTLLGSVAEEILRKAAATVVLVRPEP
jgi:nucleotide-binding universal stress UspA family protein